MTDGRDMSVAYELHGTTPKRAALPRGLATDERVADHDQQASDADQAASDVDATASRHDEADARRDQRSADRDQAIADEHPPAPGDETSEAAYELARSEREATRVARLVTHTSRTETAGTRIGTARGRDRNALARDDSALRREARALLLENAIAVSHAPVREKLERMQDLAAKDRARAAVERTRASAARTKAFAERTRLEAELQGAYLDRLTGAFRGEMGWHALQLEMDRARVGDGRFVLAFVDVDGMEVINARAGHAAGDLVLKTLASTLRTSLRPFDPIVRFVSDEFVCGIAGVDIDEVGRRLDEVTRSLYADTGAAISVGLAALAEGETLPRLLERADAEFRSAKARRPA
jgi:diguanylate cyclase (GGDEF)-like protein